MQNSNKTSRSKLALFWVLLFVVFGIVPILLMEGGLRVYLHVRYGVPGKTYGLWRYDKVLGAQHQENSYNSNAETNNFGFRNKEDVIEPKPSGALRLIAYGGSTTFCYNLNNDEAWPSQLELRLRKGRNPRDQVLNGGAILWSIGHQYARARKDLPRLRPDYVIIYSGINEQANADYLKAQGKNLEDYVRAGKYGEFATNFDQSRWVKRNVALVRLYDYEIKPALTKLFAPETQRVAPDPTTTAAEAKSENAKPNPIILENYVHVLKDMFALIRANGGEPLFVTQAYGKNGTFAEYVTSYSRAGAAIAKESGVRVVDAQQVVDDYKGKPMDLFIGSGVHYSRLGAELLAEYLHRELFQGNTKLQLPPSATKPQTQPSGSRPADSHG